MEARRFAKLQREEASVMCSLCNVALLSIVACMAVQSVIAQPAPVAGKLYLGDFQHDLIHVIDRESGLVIQAFPAPGAFTTAMQIASPGHLLVNNYTGCVDDRIYELDSNSGTILDSFPSPTCPVDGLALDSSGTLLFALTIEPTTRLIVLDLATKTQVTVIELDVEGSGARGITWLNGYLYVADETSDSLIVYTLDIGTSTAARTAEIPVGTDCPGLTNDGERLLAYDIIVHQLLEIDPATLVIVAQPLPSTVGHVAALAFEARRNTCPADLNGDGKVDQADLGILLTAWDTCPGEPGYHAGAGNLAPGDPCVTQADLGVLLQHFGSTCN